MGYFPNLMIKNILITGMPRSGKSTILNKLISEFKHKVGFVTNEVRENGERIGFEIETSTGDKSLLASVNLKTNLKVSKYFVNIINLDKIIQKVSVYANGDLLFVDEIGQMELFSEKFKGLVLNYLDSQNMCIATISKIYQDDFIKQIKSRKDVILVEIEEGNRNEKENQLRNLIKKIKVNIK